MEKYLFQLAIQKALSSGIESRFGEQDLNITDLRFIAHAQDHTPKWCSHPLLELRTLLVETENDHLNHFTPTNTNCTRLGSSFIRAVLKPSHSESMLHEHTVSDFMYTPTTSKS
jgi:hypothetical protein